MSAKLDGAKKVRSFVSPYGSSILHVLDDRRILLQSYSSLGGAYGDYTCIGRIKEGREDSYCNGLIAKGHMEVAPYKEKQKSTSPKGLDWSAIFRQADEAGRKAASECVPTPMVVCEHANPLDDNSPIVRQYAPISEGVCGFAWVTIKPANSQAANFARNYYGARPDSYEGGMKIWISQYGQSYERKSAYARAFAGVLSSYGVRAYSGSRMD